MSEEMVRAIFHKEFNYSDPKSPLSFNVKPSPDPQSRPHYIVDAAIKAGAAERVSQSSSKRKQQRQKDDAAPAE